MRDTTPEQDVWLWNHLLETLAAASGIDPELAAARVMGRFRDGTSLVESSVMLGSDVPPNDFDYVNDPDGLRCPLHAHIRKTNPRGDMSVSPVDDQRRHRIARRGMTYGLRPDLHPVGRRFFPPPRTGVGLLFLCYQANIAEQFEYIQGRWANNVDHCRPGAGLDPVIGQCHGVDENPRAFLAQTVRLRGGEYFFAPSVSSLIRMGDRQ